jgi:RNase P protein component
VLREAWRSVAPVVVDDADFVAVARRASASVKSQTVAAEMRELLSKGGVIRP